MLIGRVKMMHRDLLHILYIIGCNCYDWFRGKGFLDGVTLDGIEAAAQAKYRVGPRLLSGYHQRSLAAGVYEEHFGFGRIGGLGNTCRFEFFGDERPAMHQLLRPLIRSRCVGYWICCFLPAAQGVEST